MTIVLHPSWTRALAASPETGMGYQVVELRGLSLRPEHVFVVNGVRVIEAVRGRFAVREGVEKAVEDKIAKALERGTAQPDFDQPGGRAEVYLCEWVPGGDQREAGSDSAEVDAMQLQLERRWTEKLARLPESGMGYQRVRVRLKAGDTIEDALVFNAAVLQVADDVTPFRSDDIADIQLAAERGKVR